MRPHRYRVVRLLEVSRLARLRAAVPGCRCSASAVCDAGADGQGYLSSMNLISDSTTSRMASRVSSAASRTGRVASSS